MKLGKSISTLKLGFRFCAFVGAMLAAQTSWAVAPTINSGDAFVVENTIEVFRPVTVSNPDGNTLTFSLSGGADDTAFTIDSVTGNLDFAQAPDFEIPTDANQNNLYQVGVTVIDTIGQSDNKLLLVAVTNDTADDVIPPQITQDSSFSVAENTTEVNTSITVSNPDGFDLTFSIENVGDGAFFTIDPATGGMAFITAPDFEMPADSNQDNNYIVTVTATDSRGEKGNKIFTITVTNIKGFEEPTAILRIEEPSFAFPYSGVATLRGWAVSREEIEHIELFVDGKYHANMPTGGLRKDIAAAYPSYHQPEKSGFSMVFPYMSLDVDPLTGIGIHNVLIRVFDIEGYRTEATTNFVVMRFTDEFVSDRGLMNLDNATFRKVFLKEPEDTGGGGGNPDDEGNGEGTGFLIQGMSLNGVDYDVILEFQVATQQFEMVMIRPSALRSYPFGGVVYTIPLQAASDDITAIASSNVLEGPLILNIEEPMSDVVSSGVSNLRGWVVSFATVEKVELFVDGKYETDIPYGGTRPDVASEFPTYPNSALSGFSMAYPYSDLSRGKHTFMVRVTDINGEVTEQIVSAYTERFDDSFIDEKKDVEVSAVIGEIRKSGNRIILDNVVVKLDPFSELTTDGDDEEQLYQVILQWEPSTQQFEINEISEMPPENDGTPSGGGPKLGTN